MLEMAPLTVQGAVPGEGNRTELPPPLLCPSCCPLPAPAPLGRRGWGRKRRVLARIGSRGFLSSHGTDKTKAALKWMPGLAGCQRRAGDKGWEHKRGEPRMLCGTESAAVAMETRRPGRDGSAGMDREPREPRSRQERQGGSPSPAERLGRAGAGSVPPQGPGLTRGMNGICQAGSENEGGIHAGILFPPYFIDAKLSGGKYCLNEFTQGAQTPGLAWARTRTEKSSPHGQELRAAAGGCDSPVQSCVTEGWWCEHHWCARCAAGSFMPRGAGAAPALSRGLWAPRVQLRQQPGSSWAA